MAHRIITLLGSVIAILVATFLIVLSFFFSPSSWQFPLFLGLGSALLPGGIFAILLDLSFSTLLLRTIVSRVQALASRQIASVDGRIGQLAGKLDTSLEALSKSTEYLSQSKSLGVVMAYPDRRAALDRFLPYLSTYVANQGISSRSPLCQ